MSLDVDAEDAAVRDSQAFSLDAEMLQTILTHAGPMGHRERKADLNLGFGFVYYGLVRDAPPATRGRHRLRVWVQRGLLRPGAEGQSGGTAELRRSVLLALAQRPGATPSAAPISGTTPSTSAPISPASASKRW